MAKRDNIKEKYRLMSVSQASKEFGIDRTTLEEWFRQGHRYKRVGTRKKTCWKWHADFLEETAVDNRSSRYKKVKHQPEPRELTKKEYNELYSLEC